ncbi:MAG: OB-fold nucleic acid binding domain-containing protein [Candidatus Woesearchaeota archaeon]|nr:OB-fold nucleic acid binding domain-containing protein [Candidatus Woesearchaeota archaeon]
MDEQRLSKIALLCSLVGILLLLLIAEEQQVSASSIQNITNQSIDKEVKIKGKINTLTENPSVTIMQVQDATGEIKVILFQKKEITIKKGDTIEVQGIVKEFESKLEIEAKTIQVF